jgi:hypothetical protein
MYEYVEGGDLGAFIREAHAQGSLTPAFAARVVRRLAEILGAAHALSPPLVHRDLKPQNVLVRRGPGELYALRHDIPWRGPQSTPVEGWVERLDPITLAVTASTPRLPGGAYWPGGCSPEGYWPAAGYWSPDGWPPGGGGYCPEGYWSPEGWPAGGGGGYWPDGYWPCGCPPGGGYCPPAGYWSPDAWGWPACPGCCHPPAAAGSVGKGVLHWLQKATPGAFSV